MTYTIQDAIAHLLCRLNEVLQRLEKSTSSVEDPNKPLADLLDSMAMVEWLAVVAEDHRISLAAIEECLGRRIGTIAEMAAQLHSAGWVPNSTNNPRRAPSLVAPVPPASVRPCWLVRTSVQLPDSIESAASINAKLQRPAGWLERHAGIHQRRIWADQDSLAAASQAGSACLEQARWPTEKVGALLVTSEAPPLLTGMAANLNHRLRLEPHAPAIEIGGACTGFLAAFRIAQGLLDQVGSVLVIAVEAATRYLHVQPGPAGEDAALFGDGAAACLLCRDPQGVDAVPVGPVVLGADGSSAGLLQAELLQNGVEFRMRRFELASRAVEAMARSVRELAGRHGLSISDLDAIVVHGGNGRLPGLLARKLGLPPERIWSATPQTGNLGSASLPVAWAAHPLPKGRSIWTAVGAGLMWGAVMLGNPDA
ncbi:MAG TPA: 3-oxoacyl-[acyl-carrier-protein] synthase III C-terminal domain-containing protein [Gemmataceae bacterium]|nr:3-oxoacyl-[acyl-carrier-protein] synthase III C-terminal domain-containing protein [Gemmataceae bacterium]